MKKKRGRPKKIVKTDEILDKILKSEPEKPVESTTNTTITVIAGHNPEEQLLTMRRHLKGALMAVERFMQPFQPKCPKCYEIYGFLSKCVCNIDLKENP